MIIYHKITKDPYPICTLSLTEQSEISFEIVNFSTLSGTASLIIDNSISAKRLYPGRTITIPIIDHRDLDYFTYRVLDENSSDIDAGEFSLLKPMLFFTADQIMKDEFKFTFRLSGKNSKFTINVGFVVPHSTGVTCVKMKEDKKANVLRKIVQGKRISYKAPQGYPANKEIKSEGKSVHSMEISKENIKSSSSDKYMLSEQPLNE